MIRSPRLASLITLCISPAVAASIVVVAGTLWKMRAVERGPLEPGEKIGRSRAWIDTSGFYPAELDQDRSFSWMRDAGRIRLVRIDRSVSHTLSLWVQPAVVTSRVVLSIAVDGIAVLPTPLTPGPQRVDIALPTSSSERAIVNLTVSETRVPGGGDSRTLGLRVDGVSLDAQDGRLRVPSSSLRAVAMLGVGLGIAVALTLGARPLAFTSAIGAGGWLGFLVVFDAAFLGPYPDRLPVIGLGAVAVAGLSALAMRRDDNVPYGLRAVTGLLIVVTACKLALFLHPMVAIGDSIFHVHRAQVVQRGEYFFTSITPRPYFEFPYPPGLYVAVQPLWTAFRNDTGHVWLLRGAALVAEAALALAVYWVAFANWRNHQAAFVASIVTALLPVGFGTICTANLTNSFGQSMFGIGLATLLCVHAQRRWRLGVMAIGSALVCAGFLSHFSTFCVGIPLGIAAGVALWLGGRGVPRRTAAALVIALSVAAVVSIASYYAHFVPVYQHTIQRVLARGGASQDRSMVAPASVKATRVISTIWMEFGTAALLAASIAALMLIRARATDPLSLAAAGWVIVTLAFWLLGIFTAIEMRASLAAQPLVGILAGMAIARAIQHGRFARIVGAIAIASIVLRAMSDWTGCLGIAGFWRI